MPITLLSDPVTAAPLWVDDIVATMGISNVWCRIFPPSSPTNPMPPLFLTQVPSNTRFQVVFTNFVEPGTYALRFFVKDKQGQVSPPAYSEIVKRDQFEPDDIFKEATPFPVCEMQLHNLHQSNDVDFVKFFAVSNLEYEIRIQPTGTNIDFMMDIYKVSPTGGYIHVSHIDGTGPAGAEETTLSFPPASTYFVRAARKPGTPWGPGSYEMHACALGSGDFMIVIGYDYLTSGALPTNSYCRVNSGSPVYFPGRPYLEVTVASGIHTVEVVSSDSGFLPLEDPNSPNQVANPNNTNYGNPRVVAAIGAGGYLAHAAFGFIPHVSVAATARDAWTRERLTGAELSFLATSGPLAGNMVNRFPLGATYGSPWATQTDGRFPADVLLPTANWQMTLQHAGYSNLYSDAVTNAPPGYSFDLGMQFLSPLDANSNLMADAWEVFYFGSGTVVSAESDADGDGMSNRDEYLAGTDPTNATDRLVVWIDDVVGGEIEMVWEVANGRSYHLIGIDDLSTSAWAIRDGPWEATATQSLMTCTASTHTTPSQFYRIENVAP